MAISSKPIVFDNKVVKYCDDDDIFVFQATHRVETSLRIAIVVHVYYIDKVEHILDYIDKISYQYNLYFTVSNDLLHQLNIILAKRKIAGKIIICQNHGYDIAPFLATLPILKENGFDLVCKIHTKIGAANLEDHVEGIDDIWLHLLLDPILGSEETIEKIIYSFELDKNLGMVCSAECFKSACKLMYGNEQYTKKIFEQLGVEYNTELQWGFTAGSMFWARIDTLEPLIASYKNITFLFGEDRSMRTGASISIFHAMERVFGVLPRICNMKWGLSYAINIARDQYVIHIIHDEKCFASPTGVGVTLQNAIDEESNYIVLKKCKSFDVEYYIAHTPLSNSLGMDPFLHFLRYGVGLNAKPNKNFSPYIYWALHNRTSHLRDNPFIHYLKSSKSGERENILATCIDNDNSIQFINNSNFFDAKYYLRNNPDVVNSGIDPLLHYCHFGYIEHRNPSPVFDQVWYEKTYLAGYMEFVNPLLHYVLVGYMRGYAKNKLEHQSRLSLI